MVIFHSHVSLPEGSEDGGYEDVIGSVKITKPQLGRDHWPLLCLKHEVQMGHDTIRLCKNFGDPQNGDHESSYKKGRLTLLIGDMKGHLMQTQETHIYIYIYVILQWYTIFPSYSSQPISLYFLFPSLYYRNMRNVKSAKFHVKLWNCQNRDFWG